MPSWSAQFLKHYRVQPDEAATAGRNRIHLVVDDLDAEIVRLRDDVWTGDYVTDTGSDIRFRIEPKPNEPRGDILLPTLGHAIAFIDSLERPELVGLNPEVGHEQMGEPLQGLLVVERGR